MQFFFVNCSTQTHDIILNTGIQLDLIDVLRAPRKLNEVKKSVKTN